MRNAVSYYFFGLLSTYSFLGKEYIGCTNIFLHHCWCREIEFNAAKVEVVKKKWRLDKSLRTVRIKYIFLYKVIRT